MLEALPQSWDQALLWVGAMLALELRHYYPLIKRYFTARITRAVNQAEAEAGIATEDLDAIDADD